MSVKITGMDEILKNLEDKLGERRTTRVVNKALNETGEKVEDDVRSAVSTYMDTGMTYDEITRTRARKKDGIPQVNIGFDGSNGRWALVHLNEFGFTKNGRRITPRGVGKLRGVVDKTESSYMAQMRKELEELAK